MRLMQRKVGGLVTDGGVRDSVMLKDYGFPVYSASTTAKQGPADFWPWQVNDAIQCGGVLVRPGDAIVGDDDGVVVVPSSEVDEVIRIAHEREEVEEVIKNTYQDSKKHIPAEGEASLCGVIVDCDTETGLAKKIEYFIYGGELIATN